MQDSNKDTMFLEEMFQKIDLDKDSFISEKEVILIIK